MNEEIHYMSAYVWDPLQIDGKLGSRVGWGSARELRIVVEVL